MSAPRVAPMLPPADDAITEADRAEYARHGGIGRSGQTRWSPEWDSGVVLNAEETNLLAAIARGELPGYSGTLRDLTRRGYVTDRMVGKVRVVALTKKGAR